MLTDLKNVCFVKILFWRQVWDSVLSSIWIVVQRASEYMIENYTLSRSLDNDRDLLYLLGIVVE